LKRFKAGFIPVELTGGFCLSAIKYRWADIYNAVKITKIIL